MMSRFEPYFRSHVSSDVSWTFLPDWDESTLERLVADADVYVGIRFPASLARRARALRLVQVPGAGYDGIDLQALSSEVVVANTYHHERSVAEHVLMVMMALSRSLLAVDADLRRGVWRNPMYEATLPLPTTLRGKTVGLVGYGHIGSQIASLAAAFDMKVIAVNRHGASGAVPAGLESLGTIDDLPALLQQSDFVVMALPLTAGTKGVISTIELRSMKRDAYLINVARGPVVDEAALDEALREHWIAGAAIDVWYRYPSDGDPVPPANFPFHERDNVIMTPHYSGVTQETYRLRAVDVATNIERLRTGEELLNVVRAAIV